MRRPRRGFISHYTVLFFFYFELIIFNYKNIYGHETDEGFTQPRTSLFDNICIKKTAFELSKRERSSSEQLLVLQSLSVRWKSREALAAG